MFDDDDQERPIGIRPKIPASQNPMEIPAIASPQMAQMKTAVNLPGVRVAPPTQPEKDTNELNRLKTTGSGISQIKNPVGRTLATIGDVAASLISPGLASRIPGTVEHHNQLVNNQEGIVNNDIKDAQETAQTSHLNKETELAGKPKDPTNAFELWHQQNPNGTLEQFNEASGEGKDGKAPTVHETDQGLIMVHPDGTATPLTMNGKPLMGKGSQKPDNPEQQFIDEYQQKHKGASIAEAQRAFKQNEHIADPNKPDAEDYKRKIEGLKIYQPALDADSRLQTMRQNYNDLIKNNDQQAGLSLLSNHIGMTLGMQKGARITKDFYHEAAASAPWLQRVKAQFDDQGYLSGVVLSPEQAKQMVSLGEQMRKNQWDKARSAAEYVGIKEAPKSMIQDEQGPKVGDIVDGFKFKGGDPSVQTNWEKADK